MDLTVMFIFLLCQFFLSELAAQSPRLSLTLVRLFSPDPQFTPGYKYNAPSYELAAREIAEEYNFNVSFVPIIRDNVLGCADLPGNTYLLSEFYYKQSDQKSLIIIVGTGVMKYLNWDNGQENGTVSLYRLLLQCHKVGTGHDYRHPPHAHSDSVTNLKQQTKPHHNLIHNIFHHGGHSPDTNAIPKRDHEHHGVIPDILHKPHH